jgi:predicted nuclease of predicted toxin-antitoxin system
VKLKTDENLPVEAAEILRDVGFDAESVWDEGLSGAEDQSIAHRLRSESRTLLTLDLDFANIQAYPPGDYHGIIVLRLKTQGKTTVLKYVRSVAALLTTRTPHGELWIVERDRVRFRRPD